MTRQHRRRREHPEWPAILGLIVVVLTVSSCAQDSRTPSTATSPAPTIVASLTVEAQVSPRVSPTATVAADCRWEGTAQAWIDENGNGVQDPGEKPLSGATFQLGSAPALFENLNQQFLSDEEGIAKLVGPIASCPAQAATVNAQAPYGYELTTPGKIQNAPAGSTNRFGFRLHPLPTSRPVPTPTQAPALETMTAESTLYSKLGDIQAVAFAPDGGVWVAAGAAGALRWDLTTGEYTQYLAADGLASDDVRDVAVAPDGSAWLATAGGVSHHVGKAWMSYTPANGLESGLTEAIAVDAAGHVWAGTDVGLSMFDGKEWTWFPPAAEVVDVAVAPDGSIWTADVLNGLKHYLPDSTSPGGYALDEVPAGLPKAHPYVVAVAPNGDVWTYLEDRKLYRFGGISWSEAYDPTECGWVSDMAFAPDGTPLVAVIGDAYCEVPPGLWTLKGGTWTAASTKQGLASNNVSAVAVGPNGQIAAGTDSGLSLLEGGTWRILRSGPLRDDVTTVAVTPDGAVWMGYDLPSGVPVGGGVTRFDGRTWSYWLDDESIQALGTAPDGTLWAAGRQGLWWYDGQDFRQVGNFTGWHVYSLATARDSSIWVANGFELQHCDRQSCIAHEVQAHSVAVTRDGTVWAAGQAGLDGTPFLARFDGQTWTKEPATFGNLTATPAGEVWALAGDYVWIGWDGAMAGVSGWLHLTRYGGGTWYRYDLPSHVSADSVGQLVADPQGNVWLGEGRGLMRFDGSRWQAYSVAGGVHAAAFAPDGSLWLGGNGLWHVRGLARP